MILHDPNTAAWMSDPRRNCNPNTDRPLDIQTHADGWFPRSGNATTANRAREACDGCPVINACLDYALANPELEGLWGGTNDWDRRKLRAGKAIA